MAAEDDEFFPSSPRVIYEKHPLTQVVCQLRFPPILRIQAEPPSEFQERVRADFPFMDRMATAALPEGVPQEIAQLISAQIGIRGYNFHTEDRQATISISHESISVLTKNYTRWEQFRRMLDPALSALLELYRPNFFTRIGLRYSNAIQRSRIGLQDHKWSTLLRSEILGELALPRFEDNLTEATRTIRIKIPHGGGALFIQHGLGVVGNDPDASYLIDMDFYKDEKTGVENAGAILDRFNRQAGRGFRWFITDRLHLSLEPTSLV